MDTVAIFGEASRTFILSRAILLYTQQGQDTCAATVHDIELRDKKPFLKEGQPVTFAAIEKLAATLGRKLENSVLPERILSVSMTKMAWWCPAGRHRIWFKPVMPDTPRKDADEKERKRFEEQRQTALGLKALNGKFVQHPPLLFIAGRSFTVKALPANERPKADTKVCVAPYYNLNNDGGMCVGSAKLPDVISPSLIEKFEQAFFNSAFSHSNWGHKLTNHPGGHLGLWQDMAKAAAFDTKLLVSTPLTVNSALKNASDELD